MSAVRKIIQHTTADDGSVIVVFKSHFCWLMIFSSPCWRAQSLVRLSLVWTAFHLALSAKWTCDSGSRKRSSPLPVPSVSSFVQSEIRSETTRHVPRTKQTVQVQSAQLSLYCNDGLLQLQGMWPVLFLQEFFGDAWDFAFLWFAHLSSVWPKLLALCWPQAAFGLP